MPDLQFNMRILMRKHIIEKINYSERVFKLS